MSTSHQQGTIDTTPEKAQSHSYNLRKRKERPSSSSHETFIKPETKSLSSKEATPAAEDNGSDFAPDTGNDDLEDEYNLSPKRVRLNRTSSNKRSSTSSVRLSGISTKSSGSRKSHASAQSESEPVFIGFPGVNEESDVQEELILPDWLQPHNIRDKYGRRKDEEGYDPSSLYVPKEEFERLSGLQKRYWEIKSDHFDKLVAFRFGHFYFFYHNDALITKRILDLKLNIYGGKYSAFFHETHLKRFAAKILDEGYKLVIVEQMETSQTKEEEITRREVCQILTRGTYTEHPDPGYSPRFCLCLYEMGSNYGVVFLDTTTHEFFLGEFTDDEYKGTLKTLLARLKPMEVVYIRGNVKPETLAFCKSLSNKPALNPLHHRDDDVGLPDLLAKIEKYFEDEWPETLEKMKMVIDSGLATLKKIKQKERRKSGEEKLPFYCTLQALSICLEFLEGVLLADTVFKMGNFSSYDIALEKKSSLYLDSQALESLEVFEVGYLFSKGDLSTGSLFDYIDKTATDFGKRLLRRWIISPLLDSDKIIERQDAIEDLVKHSDVLDLYQGMLKRLPDVERMINKVYNLSNKKRMSAVYFEDFAKNRLRDFLYFLDELEKIDNMMAIFQEHVVKFKSKRLRQLILFKLGKKKVISNKKEEKEKANGEEAGAQTTTVQNNSNPENSNPTLPANSPSENKDQADIVEVKINENIPKLEEETGVFPKIGEKIAELKSMVTIKDGLPMPAEGTNEETDKILSNVGKIKTKLNIILDAERRYFGNKAIHYVHSRHRYELEIPETLVQKKRPENYVLTSKRKGFLRFHTPRIEDCLIELEEAERDLHKILVDFIVGYFRRFYDDNLIWRQVISCLSELDCLCGLAKLASAMKVKCRPIIMKPVQEGGDSIFDLKGMVHPSLAAQMDLRKKMEKEAEIKRREKESGVKEPKKVQRGSSGKKTEGGKAPIERRSSIKQSKTSLSIFTSPSNKTEAKNEENKTEQKLSQVNIQTYYPTQTDSPSRSGTRNVESSALNRYNTESDEIIVEETFIRNDFIKEPGTDVFLITGPNMGGKSTLLRQTALAVIMAQVGSMVPAHSFKLNAIDRIFTRIGAGDKILEGKSTFFLEMEETCNIVKGATRNSLLVVDELGRGTSTYDGVSLAYGTLRYIAEQIKCITLFATHYQILLEEFQIYKNVQNYYMLSEYDGEKEEVKFLYKFVKGQAERSHSFVVAKMAGLPLDVINKAKEKAAFMTNEQLNLDVVKQSQKKFNSAIETLRTCKKKMFEEENVDKALDDLTKLCMEAKD